MSDLKHQSDAELLRRLKANRKWQCTLRRDIAELEEELLNLKRRLGGSEEQSRWIVKYLEG